jgi:8-oxo-dGTP pyrophosphatase MutT (NUDIX family)
VVAEDGRSSVWKVRGERTIYDNEWIRLGLADVELPDGQRFEHHVVHLRSAAMAAVLDDHDRVLMLWRHRFVPNRWGWELPGGLVDDGEEPSATVAREILEETGYRVASLTHVISFEPMVGMVDSPHHVYVARDVSYVGEPTETTEADRLEWVPLASVPGLIAKGEVSNSGTLVALLYLIANREGSSKV